jgi:uncharacterized protein YciI
MRDRDGASVDWSHASYYFCGFRDQMQVDLSGSGNASLWRSQTSRLRRLIALSASARRRIFQATAFKAGGEMQVRLSRAVALSCVLLGCCATGDQNRTREPALAFVFLRPSAEVALTPDEESEIGRGHMANIRRLGAAGTLLFAGPTGDGGGVFILRAATLSASADILETDPAIAGGVFRTDTFMATIASGGLCEAVEPIQMMRRDLVSGALGPEASLTSLTRALATSASDLVLVNEESGRFVIIWAGPAQAERRDRARARAQETGVALHDVAEVFSPRGALCDV